MEELSKVTKISPNCRPTFKNDSGILVLQCRVYLDDHVPTRGPWRLTAGTTQWGQRGARWILSSAPSPRSWGQTPGRAGVQPGREAAFLTHRYLPHRILTIGHITGPPYNWPSFVKRALWFLTSDTWWEGTISTPRGGAWHTAKDEHPCEVKTGRLGLGWVWSPQFPVPNFMLLSPKQPFSDWACLGPGCL